MRLRSQDITWQEIDGELVILDLARSVYLTTNRTGAFLTDLLLTETTPEDLAQALVTEYGITAEEARTDVEEFLERLREVSLLA